MVFLVYPLVGVGVGVLSGLLGLGGGVIIVPVLSYLFASFAFNSDSVMHLAVGTSLAVIIPTSISSVITHIKHDAVQWNAFAQLTPTIIVGSILGGVVASYLSSDLLKSAFGVFLIIIAGRMALDIQNTRKSKPLSWRRNSVAGLVIGIISSIFGVGGGSMSVPYLSSQSVDMPKAVATSAACGLVIAVCGSVTFVSTGWNQTGLPAWSTGFVYWPAFLGIAITSVIVAPQAAGWAHRLPVAWLKRIFSALLCLIGAGMLINP